MGALEPWLGVEERLTFVLLFRSMCVCWGHLFLRLSFLFFLEKIAFVIPSECHEWSTPCGARLHFLVDGLRGCFLSEYCTAGGWVNDSGAWIVPLHPPINAEYEAGQAASSVFQIFGMTWPGIGLSLPALVARDQRTASPSRCHWKDSIQ